MPTTFPQYPSLPGLTGYSASGAPGTVASLAGAGTQAGKGPYGEVPTVPSPAATATAAYQANLAQMDRIKAIMEAINQQSAQSAQYPLLLNLPGYGAAMGQAMGNVQQMQAGQIPADVWTQLQQSGAQRGIAMGSPLSPAANTALMRAVYDTSTRLQQAGTNNLMNLMNAVPRGTQFDPSALLLNPNDIWAAQWLANQAAAAPDPTEAAMAELAALREALGLGAMRNQTYSVPRYDQPIPTTRTDTGRASAADIWAQTPLWARGGPAYGPSTAYERWRADQPRYYNPETPVSPYSFIGTPGGAAQQTGYGQWEQYGDLWYNPDTGESSYGTPPTDQPWSYQTPEGSSLTWSGQDWSDLFE